MIRSTLTALGAALLLIAGAAARAGFPTRTITVILPFAAGGTTDMVARSVTGKVTQSLGQSMVVENRPGRGRQHRRRPRRQGQARRPHAVVRAARAGVDQPVALQVDAVRSGA